MKCKIPNCRHAVTLSAKSPYCARCKSRQFKAAHPLAYFFNLLRSRAKERGKEFSLKFSEYAAFCRRTNYHLLKGKTSLSLSIDRIDNTRGYSRDNIQAITLSENTRKQFVPRLREYERQHGIAL